MPHPTNRLAICPMLHVLPHQIYAKYVHEIWFTCVRRASLKELSEKVFGTTKHTHSYQYGPFRWNMWSLKSSGNAIDRCWEVEWERDIESEVGCKGWWWYRWVNLKRAPFSVKNLTYMWVNTQSYTHFTPKPPLLNSQL